MDESKKVSLSRSLLNVTKWRISIISPTFIFLTSIVSEKSMDNFINFNFTNNKFRLNIKKISRSFMKATEVV